MPSRTSKREMNLLEKLIKQREKERDEARDLASQKERYLASKLLREKQIAMMKRIRHVFEQIQKTPAGIRYVIDDKGRKVSVQIDLTKHRQLGKPIPNVGRRRIRPSPGGTPKRAGEPSGPNVRWTTSSDRSRTSPIVLDFLPEVLCDGISKEKQSITR
jgi:hypothetical protein